MVQANKQRQAVAMVEKLGGFVTYDYMLDPSGNLLPNAQPSGLEWLRNLFGIDFFNAVVRLNLDSTDVSDGELALLEGVPQLLWLNLFNTGITDSGLEHLSRLHRLQRLELGGAVKITDVGLEHLKGLMQLHQVYLGGTQVTDEGEREFKQSLPNCYD